MRNKISAALALAILCLLVAVPAHAARTLPSCEWSPGSNRAIEAWEDQVDRMLRIPEVARDEIRHKIRVRSHDHVVAITTEGIFYLMPDGTRKRTPYVRIADMVFGTGSICRTVTMSKWLPGQEQMALVYIGTGSAGAKYSMAFAAGCGNGAQLLVGELPQEHRRVEIPGSGFDYTVEHPDPVPTGDLALVPVAIPGVPPTTFAGDASSWPATWRPPTTTGGTMAPPGRANPLGPWGPVPGVEPPGGTTHFVPRDLVPVATPIPEPSTYALMALGLGIVAWAARRRKRR